MRRNARNCRSDQIITHEFVDLLKFSGTAAAAWDRQDQLVLSTKGGEAAELLP